MKGQKEEGLRHLFPFPFSPLLLQPRRWEAPHSTATELPLQEQQDSTPLFPPKLQGQGAEGSRLINSCTTDLLFSTRQVAGQAEVAVELWQVGLMGPSPGLRPRSPL